MGAKETTIVSEGGGKTNKPDVKTRLYLQQHGDPVSEKQRALVLLPF